jgi:hypothetical protein
MRNLSFISASLTSDITLRKDLRVAVFCCTVETESGKVDEVEFFKINTIIRGRPILMRQTVDLIKGRINNQSPGTQCMAMILLAELMLKNGFEVHQYVAQSVLDKVLVLAIPRKSAHPRVRSVAATIIKSWGVTYGMDQRLFDFADAARYC